jgi:hypothetical protein
MKFNKLENWTIGYIMRSAYSPTAALIVAIHITAGLLYLLGFSYYWIVYLVTMPIIVILDIYKAIKALLERYEVKP